MEYLQSFFAGEQPVTDLARSEGFKFGQHPDADVRERSQTLFNLFYKLFDVVHADTPELRDEAHKIRYQVFCLENDGYENPEQHPDGMERDPFDKNAEHAILMFKPENRAIGTVRVIKPDHEAWADSFPLQKLCDSPYLHNERDVRNSCETSRFCISSELRSLVKDQLRRRSDGISATALVLEDYEMPFINVAMSMAPIGLMRGMCEIIMRNNALDYFAVMEPMHLENCLSKRGVLYEQIGEPMNYHGIRVPFRGNILQSYENMYLDRHDVWKVLTFDGMNHAEARKIAARHAVPVN